MERETDIYRKLKAVQAECARLREENARLRKQLGDREASCLVGVFQTARDESGVIANPLASGELNASFLNVQAAVSRASDPSTKITLFRKLFLGRQDVYAVRWTGRNGASGYSPAAVRDAMSSFKSSDRKNRKYFPLTDEVIRDHLLGKHTVGIYPLLLDETCWSLDFRKASGN